MKAFERIVVTNAVKVLDSEKYKHGAEKAVKAMLSVEGDSIRYRVDGGNPTTTVGFLVNNGDIVELEGFNDIKFFKAIRVTTDATVSVDYS